MLSFDQSGLPTDLMSKLSADFASPTPIQAQGLPIALSGSNLVGIAQTGSGKTLAFLLPALVHIAKEQGKPGKGPSVLILAPTRELAKQIEGVAAQFRKLFKMRTVCCIGGESRGRQLSMYDSGDQLMIGTPGRINDFLEARDITLENCGYVVLDEADRMLDMGFEPQIRKIVEQIRPDRQVLMWSATWPREVQQLANDFLHHSYIHINIGSADLSANHNILQIVDVCEEWQKEQKLARLLEEIGCENGAKILVFTETKRKCDELTRLMRKDGWPAMCIHGDKQQKEREWVLGEFKTGSTAILVATDVAARGLDVDDVKFVINYDYPNNSEDYIHRIGRTGRKGNTGTSYTLFTPGNAPKARDLVAVLSEALSLIHI